MKKLLTKSARNFSSGFTLIELLIVIGILGVLAVATLAVLDPVDKLRAGNDSKVQSDIANIAKAAEAYAVANNGNYPTALTTTAFGDELRSVPSNPGGYSAYSYTGGGSIDFIISGELKSKKYTPGTPVFKYSSAEGKACAAATRSAACP